MSGKPELFRAGAPCALSNMLMRRALLCRPDFYSIRYEINPWMDRRQDVDCALALAQWTALCDALRSAGCELDFIAQQPAWPDMVFTANAGIVVGRRFVRGNFRHAERAGETPWFGRWFEDHGFETMRLPEGITFEGEGDALFFGATLCCGHGFRSDLASHPWLARMIGCETLSLRLVDPRFYHLDTCFCPLNSEAALWHPEAFDAEGRIALRSLVHDLIEVPAQEAERFACNAVVVGSDVILPECCPRTCESLHARGFHAHPVPMGEFIKSGGACKCLALRLE